MARSREDKAKAFAARHLADDGPLVVPNPWDVGSARLFEHLGFEGLATTSSGLAGTRGRLDGRVERSAVLEHVAQIAAATDLPVSADLEDAYADDAAGVAETFRLAVDAGLAGASVEDFTRRPDPKILPLAEAAERVRAAVDAVRGKGPFVVTARAENHLHGVDDLGDTIRRLQAYQEAGADVLYAPGPTAADDLRRIVAEVDRPVNAILRPGGPSVGQLGALGIRRVSVGGALYWTGVAAVAAAAQQLRDEGTIDFRSVEAGARVGRAAYSSGD